MYSVLGTVQGYLPLVETTLILFEKPSRLLPRRALNLENSTPSSLFSGQCFHHSTPTFLADANNDTASLGPSILGQQSRAVTSTRQKICPIAAQHSLYDSTLLPFLMPVATTPSPSPRLASLPKMEERKRPAVSNADELAPPSKRHQSLNGSKSKTDPSDQPEEYWIEVSRQSSRSTRPIPFPLLRSSSHPNNRLIYQ